MCIYLSIYLSKYISLSIHIYIYIYTHCLGVSVGDRDRKALCREVEARHELRAPPR